MTHRQFYEYLLIELNTVKAPSLHLEDYLYLGNKGIQEYVNERYRKFQESQQLTDDLQSLNSTVIGTVSVVSGSLQIAYQGSNIPSTHLLNQVIAGNKYNSGYLQVRLPPAYFHLLNCITNIQTNIPYKCSPSGYVSSQPAKRLTNDVGAGIMNNEFLKPDYRSPYFSIVDDYQTNEPQGAIQLYYGDPLKFSINSFSIDYLKKPALITLTTAQRDAIIDSSPSLEFPEYVCNEIIKRTVKLILDNQSNPRLQTYVPINQSIE
jgi:hypothetical protein